MDPALRLALSRLGTAHILAVSGLHVAIAAALAGLLLVRLSAPLVVRVFPAANLAAMGLLVASLAAVGVAALAGATPSATRAAAMCGLATASRLLRRGPRLEACAALAGLCNLVLAPRDAFSLSFLLSYAAVLGIAVLHRPLAQAWMPSRLRENRVMRVAVQGLCVSVAASLATGPITLAAFGTLGLAAPLANLVIVPLLGFAVMPLAIATLVAAAVPGPFLGLVASVVQPAFQVFLESQRAMASWLPGTDTVPVPLVLGATCSLLVAALAWAVGATPRACACAGLLVSLACLLPAMPRLLSFRSTPSITFLDVGKGDAILIRCPTGRRYLVDTGEARALPRLLRGLTARGVFVLDGVLLTHGDEDHVGALPGLAQAVRVRWASAPCPEAMHPPLATMLASLAERGTKVTCLGLGLQALPDCGVDAPVLWPPVLAPVRGNAASLVVRLESPGGSVLLTGDLEAPQEMLLAAWATQILRADVLKLGHHGSAGSSSEIFLQAVRPSLAIVSGHASRTRRMVPGETLQRVAEVGALLRATEEHGDLTLLLKKDGILVLSKESPPFSPY